MYVSFFIRSDFQSSDVIFDLILPEWALAAFCKKFNCTRTEALETLKLQQAADMNISD